MIAYARSLSETQHLKNLTFQVMDVRTMLPKFSDNSFDFINARMFGGFMMKEDWPSIVAQYVRILRPGGVVCLTECDGLSKTTSAAFTTMQDIIARHSYEVGRTFQAADWGITPRLSRFLRNANCKNVQVKGHVIDWSAGTSVWPVVREDFTLACKLMQSYLVKAGATTDEQWDGLWEQAQEEFYNADFSALWYLVSAWGQKTV